MVKVVLSLDPKFADKFIGLIRNLISVNKDLKPPLKIESITIESDDGDIVAYPKEVSSDS